MRRMRQGLRSRLGSSRGDMVDVLVRLGEGPINDKSIDLCRRVISQPLD